METPAAIRALRATRARARSAADREPAERVRPGWPVETRNAATRERAAIRSALTQVVGADEAERLLGIADTLPPEEPLPTPQGNAWTRTRALMDTPDGRAKLKRLTWETV